MKKDIHYVIKVKVPGRAIDDADYQDKLKEYTPEGFEVCWLNRFGWPQDYEGNTWVTITPKKDTLLNLMTKKYNNARIKINELRSKIKELAAM